MHKTDHSDPENSNPENRIQPLGRFLHDLAQPLTVISNLARAGLLISSNNGEESPEIELLFEQICEEVHRAGEIVRIFRSDNQ